MTTRHLVDPDLLPLLDSYQNVDYTVEALPAIRAAFLDVMGRLVPATQTTDIVREEHRVPGASGAPDVPVLVYAPAGEDLDRPVYLDIHGGGYVLGSAVAKDAQNRRIADALDCVVVSVDYRLAPEAVYPSQLDDCYAALKWVHDAAASLHVDRDRIAVGGDSAGGGLAAALALIARDRREVGIIQVNLHSPMLDDRSSFSDHPHTGEFIWRRVDNKFGWTCLLGGEPGGDDVPPYAAAARAADLAGLPSTLITTGALDLFLEEDMDYARRLARAGVPVELHVYPGAFHGAHSARDSHIGKTQMADHLGALERAFRRHKG